MSAPNAVPGLAGRRSGRLVGDMRLTKHHGLGNDFLVLLDPDGSQPLDADLARRPVRPPHRRRRRRPHPGRARRPRRAGRAGPHGAVQRRRVPGRDERQRHPLPGPGLVLGWHGLGATGTDRADRHRRRPADRRRVHRRDDAVTHHAVGGHGRRPGSSGERARVDGRPGRPGRSGSTSATPTWCSTSPTVRRPAPVDDVDLVALGEAVNAKVPGGINVDLVTAGPRRRRHRRCASTSGASASPQACGTGACAAAAAARAWGLVGDRVAVRPCPAAAAEVAPSAPGPTRASSWTRPGHAPSASVELGDRRRGADRTGLPGADRARRRHHPARARTRTTETRSTSWRCWSTPPAPTRSAGSYQRRHAPDPATYVGKGKAEELRELSSATDCDTVVFDDELTPGPAAQPREAARPHGHRPHRGDPRHLRPERPQPGGQGPGRAGPAPLPAAPPPPAGRGAVPAGGRHVGAAAPASAPGGPARPSSRSTGGASCAASTSSRASSGEIERHRTTQRKAQRRGQLAKVAIVGYTNAGKSTLLNRLTDAGVLVEDRLFATLDATTRRLDLPGGERVLLTDTVGFIRKLPHQLVEAFKSTLDVAVDADLLVHVVDAGAPDPDGNIAAVREVLARDRRRATSPSCWSSTRPTSRPTRPSGWSTVHPGSVAVSAATGEGIDDLLARRRRPAARADHRRRAGHPLRPGRRAGRGPPGGRGAVRGGRRGRHAPAGPVRRRHDRRGSASSSSA